uniref:Uncharacterized protein n=1 Tax=Anguilla anguilla TaxID=7936 RepID=A0A0E9W615_ANGAN
MWNSNYISVLFLHQSCSWCGDRFTVHSGNWRPTRTTE